MRFRRTLAEPDEPIELNLIPLIDVIMFLLIFFIATTSFVEEPGISVERSRRSVQGFHNGRSTGDCLSRRRSIPTISGARLTSSTDWTMRLM